MLKAAPQASKGLSEHWPLRRERPALGFWNNLPDTPIGQTGTNDRDRRQRHKL